MDGSHPFVEDLDNVEGTILARYIRLKSGFPKGLVVSYYDVEKNVVKVGWSLCNYKAGDEWNRRLAFRIAVGRAKPIYWFYETTYTDGEFIVERQNEELTDGYWQYSTEKKLKQEVPNTVRDFIPDMLHRAEKFFKEKTHFS